MIRLKQLREELGISQTTFSKQIGFGQSTISNWENGNRVLDVNTATTLANFFEVSVDYLIGNSDIRNIKVSSEERAKKGTIQIAGRDGSFIERELTDEQIDIVRRMVEQMPDAKPKVDTLLGVAEDDFMKIISMPSQHKQLMLADETESPFDNFYKKSNDQDSE